MPPVLPIDQWRFARRQRRRRERFILIEFFVKGLVVRRGEHRDIIDQAKEAKGGPYRQLLRAERADDVKRQLTAAVREVPSRESV